MRETPVPTWVLDLGHPLVSADQHPLADLIRDCLEELAEEDEEAFDVLTAWAYERLTYREIAERGGLAGRSSGKYKVDRALSLLAAKLAEHGITNMTLGGNDD